jgi:hypothetical protein
VVFSIGGRCRQKKSGDREGVIAPSRTALARDAGALPDLLWISQPPLLQRQIRLEDLLQTSGPAARLGLK